MGPGVGLLGLWHPGSCSDEQLAACSYGVVSLDCEAWPALGSNVQQLSTIIPVCCVAQAKKHFLAQGHIEFRLAKDRTLQVTHMVRAVSVPG